MSNRGRQLAATFYGISGLEQTRHRFRLLKVREPVPNDNYRPIRIQRWADTLWRKELHCPVYPTARLGMPGFLIPEGNSPAVGHTIEIRDVPDIKYHIEVIDQVIEIATEDARGNERELVCRMLERPFTDKLQEQKNKFWRSEFWNLFYRLTPENQEVDEDVMYAYRGLKFGVVILQPGSIHFAADIRSKYVGKQALPEYSEADKQLVLSEHLDLDTRVDERAYFIRDNGAVKIPCRYTGTTERTIDEYTFDDSGKTIYEYYRDRYPEITLDPKELAVSVQDRSKETSIPVPISRLFPVFTNEYEGMRRCSIRSQMTPTERVNEIDVFLQELNEIYYNNLRIEVGRAYFKRPRTVFAPPRLEFGQGEILDPFPKGRPLESNSLFDKLTIDWINAKLTRLYKVGPYHNEPIPNVVLLYPETLERPTRETLINDLKREISLQTKQTLNIIQQRSYKTGNQERRGTSLLRFANEIHSTNRDCLAGVILWNRLARNVHGELKETLKPVLSQCVTERVVQGIVRRNNPQLATSQVRNLALGILTEAGVKPWVLADDLRHDLHIGIDLLYGRVGYHFLYGTGGRIIQRDFGQSVSRGRMREAIKKPELRQMLEKWIREIVEDGYPLKRIVIHRDGRWWRSEREALHEAIANLQKQDLLPPDICCTVVEIRKNHLPVRIFTEVTEDTVFLQNPLLGTYLILDQQRALLTPTGRPGAWDNKGKTASNLLLEIVDTVGEANIEDIVQDAYYLTHLNWNAPDIEIALPVTIRWTDESLRETFRLLTEDDEEDETDDSTLDEWNSALLYEIEATV